MTANIATIAKLAITNNAKKNTKSVEFQIAFKAKRQSRHDRPSKTIIITNYT